MKYEVFFTLSFLLLPVISFATSGACSSHLGVNCSMGADFDGSVICYDGWRKSTVSYSFADECKNQSATTCDVAALNALLNSSGLAGSDDANQRMKDCIAKNNIVSTPAITPIYTQTFSVPVETQQEKQIREDKQCHDRYSDFNSHAENGYCVCNTGYVLYSNTGVCELKKTEMVTPVVAPIEQISPTENAISTHLDVKSTQIKTNLPKKVISKKSIEQKKTEIKKEITPVVEQPAPIKKTFWQKFKGFFGF